MANGDDAPVCTVDEYEAADSDSSSMATTQQDSASGTCPEHEESFEPCDVDYVTLAETQGSKEKVYESKGGQFVEKKPDFSKQRKISTTGADGGEGTVLMVTGDKPGAASPTKVEVLLNSGGVGFCGAGDHPKISVASDGATLLAENGEQAEFEASRELYGYELTDSNVLKSLLSPYWPLATSPKIYDIDVDVCGKRDEGSVHGGRRMRVEVYPSDQYTLKLKIPPFKKTKHEVSAKTSRTSEAGIKHNETTRSSSTETSSGWGKDRKTTGSSESSTTSNKGLVDTKTSSQTSTGDDGVVHTQSTTQGKKGMDDYYGESESMHFRDQGKVLTATESTDDALAVVLSPKPPDGVQFEISRNGKVDETAHKVQEILHTLKNLEYTFKEVFNTIKRVPSIGWKATLDVSFFSGDLYFTWGFREAKDWQVGYGFTAGVQVKIVDIAATLSFGVDLSVLTAQISGTIGGTVSMKGEIAGLLKAGDGSTDLSGKLAPEGKITVNLKGEALIGHPSIKVINAEAGVETGFVVTCEPKITREDGLFFEYDIKFLPITFYYQSTGLSGRVQKTKYEATKTLQVAKGRFPEATKTDPAIEAKKTGLVAG